MRAWPPRASARGRLVERRRYRQHHLLVFESHRCVIVAQMCRSKHRECDANTPPKPQLARPSLSRVGCPTAGSGPLGRFPGGTASSWRSKRCVRVPSHLETARIRRRSASACRSRAAGFARRKLVLARQVQERRQHRSRGRLARRDELRHREVADVRRGPLAAVRIDIGDRAVRRAQIDSDKVMRLSHPPPRDHRANPSVRLIPRRN